MTYPLGEERDLTTCLVIGCHHCISQGCQWYREDFFIWALQKVWLPERTSITSMILVFEIGVIHDSIDMQKGILQDRLLWGMVGRGGE
jgi:hypothetical protein